MSLHFQQYLTEGSDELYVDPNINLNILEAEYDLMNMALECDREIFMEGCKEDYYEIACRYGMVNESYNVINEGALEDLWNKVKEFAVKAWTKVKELIMSVINKMRMLCTKDGATLVNKYSKQAHENFRLKNMENVRFKWREENNKIAVSVCDNINNIKLNKFDNYYKKLKSGSGNGYDRTAAHERIVKLTNSNHRQSQGKDKENYYRDLSDIVLTDNDIKNDIENVNKTLKPFDADEIAEMKDNMCKEVNSTFTDFNSLKEDYFEYRLKDEEELEGTEFPLHEAENILKDYKKMTRDLEKEQKQCDKAIRDTKKDVEKFEKDMIKALREKDATLTHLVSQRFSSIYIQILNVKALVASKFYSLEFEVLKTRYRYAKTGFIKCATFAGKSYNESTVLIDEFVAYELNV